MAKKPTYEELEQEVNLLRLMCDNVPDLIWSKDLEGRFLFVNQAMCDNLIMCDRPDKALGKTDMFFAEQQRNAGHEHTFGEKCIDSDAIIKEKRAPGRFLEDGLVSNKYLVLDVHKAPFLNEDGEMIGTVGCGRDVTKEKETEEALQESEFRFRRMVENMPVGAGYVEGEKVFLNKATERITGYKPSDFQTLNQWFRNMYSEDHEIVRAYYDKDYEAGFPSSRVVSLKRKDGQIRFVEFTCYRFEGGSVWIFQDITDRKRAEEALRDSNEKLTALFQSSPMAIITLDPDGNVTFWNPAAEKMFGWREKEVIGRFIPYVPEEKKSEHHALRNRVLSGEGFHDVEALRQKKDGSDIYISISSVPLKDSTGSISGIMSVIVDITERKEAEEALRKSQQIIEGIINTIPVRVFWKDRNHVFLGCNALFAQDAGFADPKDIIGKDDYQMVWRDQAELYRDDDRQVIESGRPKFLIEEPQTTPEGNTITLLTSKAPLRSITGEINGVLGTYMDITERKKMEEELLRIQKLESVGLLAGGIAHDFNNILTTILGNVSLARMQVNPEDDLYELLREAETASIRAQTLTRQLLTFAKGGAPLKEIASIKNILKESCSFMLRGSKSSCEFSIAKNLWPAEVDIGQISQVINNIVINANQAMPKGGTIQVAAENLIIESGHGLPVKPGRYIRISITDQGVGIGENHFLNIFDPYFTTKQEGSGLGLATAYSIIKKHNGHIAVESQLGVGTTFHIYLPASDKAIPEKEKVKVIKGQGRILVMDDEVALRKVVGKMLAMLGYEAEFAQDGAEAIRMVKEAEKPYDAVILDLTIPGGMGGKEAINKLLEIDPELKAIVSSGYSDDPVLANFQEYGFKGIMPKPFQSQLLSKVLHEVLKGEKE